MIQHAFPNPILAPAREAFEHAVPVAILTGQQPPLCTAAAHPLDRFDEPSAGGLVSHIGIWVLSQKVPNFRPLFVGYVYVAHALTLNNFCQTSTEPRNLQLRAHDSIVGVGRALVTITLLSPDTIS